MDKNYYYQKPAAIEVLIREQRSKPGRLVRIVRAEDCKGWRLEIDGVVIK